MNINDVTARKEYVGNGSTTIFAYDFGIVSTSDIEVIVGGVVQTLGTHYSVSGAGVDSGGNVTFVTAPSNSVNVILLRKQPFSQLSVYQANEDFPAKRLETDLSKEMMAMQQIREILARVPTVLKTSLLKNFILPEGVIGNLMRWKSTTELENILPTAFVPGAVTLPLSLANGGTGSNFVSVAALLQGIAAGIWDYMGILTPSAGIVTLPNPMTGNWFNLGAGNVSSLSTAGVKNGTRLLMRASSGSNVITNSAGLSLFGANNYTMANGDIMELYYDGGSWNEILRVPVQAVANITKFWRGDGTWQFPTLHETGGPTDLTGGAIAAGTFLTRSGSTIVGVTLPFTSEFISSDQTVTLSSLLNVAHGFGAKPKLVQVTLKNATTEGGFTVSDEVPILGLEQSGVIGTTVVFDATNVSILSQATIRVLGKTGPATEINITAANWKYVVRAWK